MALAIKTLKVRIAEAEAKLAEIDLEIKMQSDSLVMVGKMYSSFIGWADEFANATLEQKKMIVGQIIKRELEKCYKINIKFNMDYEQFCREWT